MNHAKFYNKAILYLPKLGSYGPAEHEIELKNEGKSVNSSEKLTACTS